MGTSGISGSGENPQYSKEGEKIVKVEALPEGKPFEASEEQKNRFSKLDGRLPSFMQAFSPKAKEKKEGSED